VACVLCVLQAAGIFIARLGAAAHSRSSLPQEEVQAEGEFDESGVGGQSDFPISHGLTTLGAFPVGD
jgi:hypothetical protein